MIVQVLGMGCSKYNILKAKVKEVAAKNNIEILLEKVTDFKKIMDHKVMMTVKCFDSRELGLMLWSDPQR